MCALLKKDGCAEDILAGLPRSVLVRVWLIVLPLLKPGRYYLQRMQGLPKEAPCRTELPAQIGRIWTHIADSCSSASMLNLTTFSGQKPAVAKPHTPSCLLDTLSSQICLGRSKRYWQGPGANLTARVGKGVFSPGMSLDHGMALTQSESGNHLGTATTWYTVQSISLYS